MDNPGYRLTSVQVQQVNPTPALAVWASHKDVPTWVRRCPPGLVTLGTALWDHSPLFGPKPVHVHKTAQCLNQRWFSWSLNITISNISDLFVSSHNFLDSHPYLHTICIRLFAFFCSLTSSPAVWKIIKSSSVPSLKAHPSLSHNLPPNEGTSVHQCRSWRILCAVLLY